MKKTKPKKLLTVLLTLYLALSIVPITVFADSGSYAVKFYPGDYGTMTKNDQIPFVYYGFDDDVNKPYYYKLNVSETETLSFASSIINVLLPNSDYEFAYWKADATVYQVGSGTAIPAGTALSSDQLQNKITVKSDVTFTAHFKQISEYPDDSVITSAAVQNVKFNYQPGDAPQATAEVYNADADKYEIAYECWQEFENNEPVAAWYSDNGSHGSLPTITEFESGKRYVYSLMLKPKDGYSFNSETTVTVNGESVKSSLSGEYLYVPAVKTITPTKQNTVITSAAVENVKLDYKDGETPRTTPQPRQQPQTEINTIFSMNVGVSWKKPMSTQPNPWHTGIQTRTIVPQVMQILPPLIRMASMNIPYDWKPKTATSLVTAFQPMILPSTAKVCPKAHLL